MNCWGLVPARGGSKSISRKNLVSVGGLPLLDYGVRAALASGRLSRIYCSTDDAEIADRARLLGIESVERPPHLATDDARVDSVAEQFLNSFDTQSLPDAVVLIQPTSPFLLPQHIGALIDRLASQDCPSAHSVTPVSHNLHAWNQRTINPQGQASFLFADERRRARNKQEKPALFAFGNLIAARTEALLSGAGFYSEPCTTTIVDAPYNFDLDNATDLQLAELLLQSGLVELPHITLPTSGAPSSL